MKVFLFITHFSCFQKGTLRIIDLPGHERLRFQFLEQYKSLAR